MWYHRCWRRSLHLSFGAAVAVAVFIVVSVLSPTTIVAESSVGAAAAPLARSLLHRQRRDEEAGGFSLAELIANEFTNDSGGSMNTAGKWSYGISVCAIHFSRTEHTLVVWCEWMMSILSCRDEFCEMGIMRKYCTTSSSLIIIQLPERLSFPTMSPS